jgi:hypothetical protein
MYCYAFHIIAHRPSARKTYKAQHGQGGKHGFAHVIFECFDDAKEAFAMAQDPAVWDAAGFSSLPCVLIRSPFRFVSFCTPFQSISCDCAHFEKKSSCRQFKLISQFSHRGSSAW